MNIQTLGKEIQSRRQATGLTQLRLAKLANLSRQTVQRLEAGTIKDLSFQRIANLLGVLGLKFDSPSLASREQKRGLWMAAKTSSVSYRNELSVEQLRHALVSGEVPSGFESHMRHFLDEAPIPVVVMAVEEAAELEMVSATVIWSCVAKLANKLDAARKELWS
jgi:transcriptional regulator with XRE-family HTH domain